MAAVELSFAESFGHELGERDGALTFEEACLQIQGQKLIGPPMKPLKGDRAPGDLRLIDLPLRDMSTTSGKCEQFVDIIQNHLSEGPLKVDQVFLDTKVYPLCAQSKPARTFLPQNRADCALQHAVHHSLTWTPSSMCICTRTRCGPKTWWRIATAFLYASSGVARLA